FAIASVRLEDGAVHWTDQTTTPPTDLWVRSLDVRLKNVSLAGPVSFEIRTALCSNQPNVTVTGRVQPPLQGNQGALEAFVLETDLKRMNVDELIRAVPSVKALGLREGLAGRVRVTIDRLALDPQWLAKLAANVQ